MFGAEKFSFDDFYDLTMISNFPTIIGYVAGSLWLLTFCMRRMAPLRFVAILSSCAWVTYAWCDDLYPIIFVHTILLPLNTARFFQALHEPQPAPQTDSSERPRRMPPGWRERARQRRALAVLRTRDFGDLSVPGSLLADELRRCPWQRFSAQWGEIHPAGAALRSDPVEPCSGAAPILRNAGYGDEQPE